jgi:hypothetical protein
MNNVDITPDGIMNNLYEIVEGILAIVVLVGFAIAVMIFSLVLWVLYQSSPLKISKSYYRN